MGEITVHSKRYCRVVLERLEAELATPESYALKMSMRLRMALPRAQMIVRHLPKTIRSGLDVSQANKLKAVLEDLGGIARLETHFVTPGEGGSRADSAREDGRAQEGRSTRMTRCPACGWEETAGAEHCSMCHEPFLYAPKRKRARPKMGFHSSPDGRSVVRGIVALWHDHKLPVAMGAVIVILGLLVLAR